MFDIKNFSFNIYALPIFFVGCLVLWTGIFVFLQNRRSLVNFSFGLMCLAISIWMWGASFMYFAKYPAVAAAWYKYVSFFGVVSIMPSAYFFSAVWVGLADRKYKVIVSGYVVSYFFYALVVSTDLIVRPAPERFFWGYYPKYGMFSLFFLAFFALQFADIIRNLKIGYGAERIDIKKSQIKMIMAGFLIGIIASADFVPKLTRVSWYPFGYISMFIFCCVVGYTIVKYRIFDIETVFHKTVAWFFTSAAFVLPLVTLIYFTKEWCAGLAPLNSLIYLTFVLLGFLFLVNRFKPKIDKLFQRGRADLEDVLSKFSNELVHLRNLKELVDKITDTVVDTIYAGKVNILLYDDKSKKMIGAGSANKSIELDPQGPLLRWFCKNNIILNREFIDIDPVYSPIREEAKEYFQKQDAAVGVPLVLNEKLLGLINIGRKINLKPFNTFDFQFLAHLKNQSTIAVSNSLVYDRVEETVRTRTKELVWAQRQLIQAEKLATIGTLSGGVAHEINNPLTAILTNAQMLLGAVKTKDDAESLMLIEEAAKRCRTIVQKLMVYSRKSMGTRGMGKVDLEKVLNSAISFLGYQMAQENIKITVSTENPPFVVWGCQNELEQVVTNMILNGKDAIRDVKKNGEIAILLSKDKNKIIIKVRDDGSGISKEHINKIFDPFFTTKDVGKGTGLGLSICQSIIDEHKGDIKVESKEGSGAVFIVTLPVYKEG